MAHLLLFFVLQLAATVNAEQMIARASMYQAALKDGLLTYMGEIIFTQDSMTSPVKIEGSISILNIAAFAQNGSVGFHVHQMGLLGNNCMDAKAHYNPTNKNHGAPYDKDRHVGDLGNVNWTTPSRSINFTFSDSIIQLKGQYSIVGRALVLHQEHDDLGKGGQTDSLTTGHAGARLACGVIAVASDFNLSDNGQGRVVAFINCYHLFMLISVFVYGSRAVM